LLIAPNYTSQALPIFFLQASLLRCFFISASTFVGGNGIRERIDIRFLFLSFFIFDSNRYTFIGYYFINKFYHRTFNEYIFPAYNLLKIF